MPQISTVGFAFFLFMTGFAVIDCHSKNNEPEHALQWDKDGDCACASSPCKASTNKECAKLTSGDCRDDDANYLPSHCTAEEQKDLSHRIRLVHSVM